MKVPGTLDGAERTQTEAEGSRPETGGSRYPELEAVEGQRGNRFWWVWLLVFVGVVYGCYKLYGLTTAKKTEAANKRSAVMRPRAIPVATAKAHVGNLPVYLQGLGTVTAFNTVAVKTRVDGQLTAIYFHEGQFVKQGQPLAQIDPRPYQVALQSANSTLAQANGNLAKDQASLRDAQVNVERYQELYKSQIIAKQQLDTQAATADQLRGGIAADQAAIATADAQISNAKLNLTYTNITAPLSGRIGLRQTDVGNMIHAADANGIAVITQLQPIAVLFSIPEEQLPPVLQKLRAGDKLRTEAYDRDGKTKIADGTLLTVDNQIDPTTGTSKLKAVFSNEDNALFPNQFVNMRLALDVKRDAVIVPAVAIQRGPSGTFVYLVSPQDSSVSTRPVKVGISEGTDISIEDGLQANDEVVVDGAEKLTDGMQVTVHNGPPGTGGSSGRRGGQGASGYGRRGAAQGQDNSQQSGGQSGGARPQ